MVKHFLCVVVGVLFILFNNIVNGQSSYTANLVSGESNSGPLSGYNKNENFIGIVAGNTAIGGGQLTLKLNRNGCPSACYNASYAGAAWRHESLFGYGTTTISAKGTSHPGSVVMLTISDFSTNNAVRLVLAGSYQNKVAIDTFTGNYNSPVSVNLGFSHSAAFNTYKIVRTATSLTCFANNVQIYTTTNTALIPTANLKIEISYEAHSSWWGTFSYPGESTAFINSISFTPAVAPTSTPAPTVKPTPAPTPKPTVKPTLAPTPPPAEVGTGLLGGYFLTDYFLLLNATRLDATVNFDWQWVNPGPGFPLFGGPDDRLKVTTFYSITWNGWVRPQYTENYVFHIKSDDRYKLYINGNLVISYWTKRSDAYPVPGEFWSESSPISLVAGTKYTIQLHWAENGNWNSAQLYWSSASVPRSIIPTSCLFPASSPLRPALTHPTLTYTQKPSIPSNFNISNYIANDWPIPIHSWPDTLGAFRFMCNPSHLLYDDPVVYPGQPGISHLHQFFGNTLSNGHSTYESLRTTGNSTCSNRLNRSSYWMPALLNNKDLNIAQVVLPDNIAIYYKRYPNVDPYCQVLGLGCVPIPRGLRFVFGFDFANPGKGLQSGYFTCDGKEGSFEDLASAAKGCPTTSPRLGVHMATPECWDGVNLDSWNHRDHVAYPIMDYTIYTLVCPPTHPYVIPVFTLKAFYTPDATLDRTGKQSWLYSSDMYPNGTIGLAGSTFHADWFGAWDDDVLSQWEENCINGLRSCNDNDLGNGKAINQYPDFKWNANPRLVPIPPRPSK